METNKAETKAESKETKVTSTPPVKEEVKVETPRLQFPREISKIVYVRRRERMGQLPGQDPDDAKLKIGSSFKGSSVNRGLTFEEEVRFLSEFIGVNEQSPNWEKATKEYWANISKPVPPKDGLKLEVGLKYFKEDDYNADRNRALNANGVLENPKGVPINLADYILYRYCLVYNEVANSPELVSMSPKINFYLFNKDNEIREKKVVMDIKRKAAQLLYSNMFDRTWVEHMLRNLVARDSSKRYTIKGIMDFSEDERDVLLEEFLLENPSEFLSLGNDKHLEMKSFVEIAIASGKLSRIANTNTITLDGEVIGNSIDETVSFLNNPKNSESLMTLKAQLRVGI